MVKKLFEAGMQQGFAEGRDSMVPIVVAAGGIGIAVGAGIVVGVQKIIHFFAKKPDPEAIEAVKSELIAGIQEYDETHPDDVADGGE